MLFGDGEDLAVGDALQFGGGQAQHGVDVAAAAVNRIQLQDGRVDKGAQRLAMAEGGHAADDVAGDVERLLRVGKLHFLAAHRQPGGDFAPLDSGRAVVDDQQRFILDDKDQRLDNLLRRNLQGAGCVRHGRRMLGHNQDFGSDLVGIDKLLEIGAGVVLGHIFASVNEKDFCRQSSVLHELGMEITKLVVFVNTLRLSQIRFDCVKLYTPRFEGSA